MQPSNSTDGPGLTTHLLHDHKRLEARFQRMVETVRTADRPTIQREWDDFERVLLGHLAWEEQSLLPRFGLAKPVEAVLIKQDHARIRALLTDLGLQLDLRSLRAERVDEFMALLRTHSALEERVLYRWAETGVPAHEHEGFLTRLKHQLDGKLI